MNVQGPEKLGLVAMLLDNHYAPDNRVRLEAQLMRSAGHRVRVIAWDRRTREKTSPASPPCARGEQGEEVVRIRVPAPPGGGLRSLIQVVRLGIKVLVRRRELLGDADLLVVHDIYLLPLGWLLARFLSLPFAYDAHEEFAVAEVERYPRVLLRCAGAFETLLARSASAVVVPGHSRVERWTAVGISPLVLPNLGRTTSQPPATEPYRDIVYCGTLASVRRLDLLADLARRRPDLRIAVAGRGRDAEFIRAAAAELPNLEYSGWTDDPDGFLATGRSIYYGLDPSHPYAEKACPNTLYQAIRLQRPLIFFCGGEPEAAAASFAIGMRCLPSGESLAEAVDTVCRNGLGWEFDAAWRRLASPEAIARYVSALEELLRARDSTKRL
jgi:hypothetical protein